MEEVKLDRKIKNNHTAFSKFLLIFLLVVFCFLNPLTAKAVVEFNYDTVLALDGLDQTIYIASGSKIDYFSVSATVFSAYGIWDSVAFLLKTTEHKVLQMTPSGGTADLTFSSTYVSSGYVNQWEATSSVPVAYIVGVPNANTNYAIKLNGSPIAGSPFNSGASAEILFNYTGSGIFTVANEAPSITSISESTDPIRSEETQTITPSGVSDPEENSLYIYCCQDTNNSCTPTTADVCNNNQAWTSPYSGMTCTLTAPTVFANTTYYARCRVYDSSSYSGNTVSTTYTVMAAAAAEYGVELNPSSLEFEEWAWGGNPTDAAGKGVIGWVSSNSTNCDSNGDGLTDTGNFSQCPVGQAISDYAVTTTVSYGPTVSNLLDSYACPCDQSRIPNLSWDVVGADPNYDYEIQICSEQGCEGAGDPIIYESVENTNSTSWSPACNYCCKISPYDSILWGGGTYYWRVRARHTGGTWSSWRNEDDGFVTYPHCYPYSYFVCSYDGNNWYDCDGNISDGKCAATAECLGPLPFSPPVETPLYIKDVSTCHNADNSSFDAVDCSEYGFNATTCPSGYVTTYYNWDFVNATSTAGNAFATSVIEVLEVDSWTISATTTDTHSPDEACGQEEQGEAGLPLPEWREISPY